MAERFCTQCGAEFPDEARFCVQCGAPRQAPANAGAQRDPSAGRGGAATSAPSNLSRYAPALVVLAVLALVLGTVFVGLLNPRKPTQIVERQGAAGAPAAGTLPQDHPPLAIPEQVKEAIADLEKKAEENRDDVRSWTHLAEVLYRAGQIEKSYLERAGEAFEHVIEIDSTNTDALRGLGNIAFDRNDPTAAIGFYERFLEQKPDDLSVQTDLGTMFLAAGDVEKAVRAYDAVLKVDPTFFQAQFNLAIAYRTAGQDDAALAALRAAREHAPDEATRTQIDELLARADGAAPPRGDEASAAPASTGFRSSIEAIFRTHQILASKVQRFDWQDDERLSAVLTGFPMDQMPESMRDLFLGRMKDRIAQAKSASGVDSPLTIELVDFESGEVMDTIVQ